MPHDLLDRPLTRLVSYPAPTSAKMADAAEDGGVGHFCESWGWVRDYDKAYKYYMANENILTRKFPELRYILSTTVRTTLTKVYNINKIVCVNKIQVIRPFCIFQKVFIHTYVPNCSQLIIIYVLLTIRLWR